MEEDMLLELARTFYFTDNYRVRTEPVNHLMHDFIILLFDTGMRPWCEAHNIRGSWLTYDDEGLPLIRIPKAFTKTKKSRDIPMTGRVFRMLEKRCKGQDPDFRLFSKLMYKWHIGRFWNEVVRPTMGWGPDEVWYGMRHTFATRLVEVGTDIRVVQALLGHRNITQTARYAKVTNVILQNSIAALDSFGIKHQRPIQIEDNREDKHLPNNNPNEGQLHIHG
jgi:integrase